MESPAELLEGPGPGPDVLLGLDHLHDLQHKLKIVVVETGVLPPSASSAASAGFLRGVQDVGPCPELGSPLFS